MEDFIALLYNEFEDIEKGALTPSTNFRDLDEWSSMHALIIIALVDAEYDVVLNGEDLSQAETIKQLYDVIQNKVAA